MYSCNFNEVCKLVARSSHPENTIIKVGSATFGNGSFTVIAGPCAVESEEQLYTAAKAVKSSGALLLRAGAFKPRTSPYSFQGLGVEGLAILANVKKELKIPVISEMTDASQLTLFCDVDIIQVGARNMQNYELLKCLGRAGKPVIIKRSPASTYEELLLSAEYLMAEGNEQVILCERGIRSFGSSTRYTPDVVAIPMLKSLTHLPVIADPSHSTGRADMVEPVSLAYAAAGADGILIEVHPDPARSLCDGAQAITPDAFDRLSHRLKSLRDVL